MLHYVVAFLDANFIQQLVILNDIHVYCVLCGLCY